MLDMLHDLTKVSNQILTVTQNMNWKITHFYLFALWINLTNYE